MKESFPEASKLEVGRPSTSNRVKYRPPVGLWTLCVALLMGETHCFLPTWEPFCSGLNTGRREKKPRSGFSRSRRPVCPHRGFRGPLGSMDMDSNPLAPYRKDDRFPAASVMEVIRPRPSRWGFSAQRPMPRVEMS